jgi:prophage antirepressor-like protein
MNQITTFNYSATSLRVVTKDNEPWFVASDVCTLLAIGNTSLAVNGRQDRIDDGLDPDEKGVATVNTPGGVQEMVVVNESGLYALIFKSRKPEAKKFKKWVTSEVLPAIRKNGFYIDPTKQADLFEQATEAEPAMDMATELSLLRRLDATQSLLIQTQADLVSALRAQLAPKPKRRVPKRLTPEDIMVMKALKQQGMSGAEIARRLDVSTATVSYLTREVDSKH